MKIFVHLLILNILIIQCQTPHKNESRIIFKVHKFDLDNDQMEVSFEIFDYWVKTLQIILKKNYELSFEYCEGKINAYYSSSEAKILICYELIEEFMSTRYEIILLKNSL